MNSNEIRLTSVVQILPSDAHLSPSRHLRLKCQITAAALILALLPLLLLITAAVYFTSDQRVFVRRLRWLGGRNRVTVLEYRDSRFLQKTNLIVLPMLFEIAAGKRVLSSEEVKVFLRGVRRVFQR